MATLCTGLTHIYHNALPLTLRSPQRLTWTSMAKTMPVIATVDPRRSANYQPCRWDHNFLLSLENTYAVSMKQYLYSIFIYTSI